MKRKWWPVCLVCCLICLCMAVTAWAEEASEQEEFSCEGYRYVLNEDGTAKITEYIDYTGSVTIPEELDGHRVTAIVEEAYFSSGMRSVTIPAGITSIGENPFRGCESLRYINVAADNPVFASIDGVLFNKQEKKLVAFPAGSTWTSYNIPYGIKSIGDDAFYCCISLASIGIPSTVTSIGDGAFFRCVLLPEVTVPGSVASIGEQAFYNCESLNTVLLSEGVTAIGKEAFAGCYVLGNVVLPGTLTEIGESAFMGCSQLKTLKIPDSVSAIGPEAFGWSEQLVTEVTPGSYAEQYAKENDVPYCYENGDTSWLNG